MLGLLAPGRVDKPAGVRGQRVFSAQGTRTKRVALLAGCVQQVLATEINDATIRLLNRNGCEVVIPPHAGCCGALTHHLGREAPTLEAARRNIDAWWGEIEAGGLDAIIVNASGCGTMVKDYGFLLRSDPAWAERAAQVSGIARDIGEFFDSLGIVAAGSPRGLLVGYQAACSLRHGQNVDAAPKRLLTTVGYEVREPVDAHLCCGSAGTYNILQAEIAGRLRARKAASLEALSPGVIATGNVGCMVQLRSATTIPVVHTVELLDWATGGPRPGALGTEGVQG